MLRGLGGASVLWVGFVVALAAGLAPGEGRAQQWEGTVSDSAGVRIVTNSGSGLWTPARRWSAVEELRIGSLDEPSYQFGKVRSLAVDADGTMFVLDAQARAVRVYDARGSFQRTIGGPGGGPGELAEGATFIGLGAGDTLLVADPYNGRLNIYDGSGRSIGTVRLGGLGTVQWHGTAGGVIARQIRPDGVTSTLDAVERLSIGGVVLDTLARFPTGATFDMSGPMPSFTILAAEPVWALGGGSVIHVARTDQYVIRTYVEGRLRRIVQRAVERRDFGESAIEGLRNVVMDAAGGAEVPVEAVEMFGTMLSFPATHPEIWRLAVGPENTLWVQPPKDFTGMTDAELETIGADTNRLQQGRVDYLEGVGAPSWDVFDADGRFLGVVDMPSGFRPVVFVGDRVYGVWSDAIGVEYVVRVRIEF